MIMFIIINYIINYIIQIKKKIFLSFFTNISIIINKYYY